MRHPFVRVVAPLVSGMAAGILAREAGDAACWALLAPLLALAALALGGLGRGRRRLPVVLGAASAGAAITVFWSPRPVPATVWLPPRAVVMLDGTLAGPVRRIDQGFRAELRSLSVRVPGGDFEDAPGNALVRLPADGGSGELAEGDRIRIRARIRRVEPVSNPGVRDPARTLLDRGVLFSGTALPPVPLLVRPGGSVLAAARDPVRARFREWIEERAPCDALARGLVQAVVLGDSGATEQAVRDGWRRSGLSHLLAISGLHIGLIAWVVFRVVAWVVACVPVWTGRFRADTPAALAGILAAWAYVLVAGAPVSAVRAGWMLTGLLGARLLGRGPDAASALALAGLCVCVHDPMALTDPSAQLSFAAIGSLALGLAPLRRLSTRIRDRMPYPLAARCLAALLLPLGASLLCTLGTLPFVVWHFQALPLAGLVANVAAIPLAAWGIVIPGLLALALVSLGLEWPASLVARWLDIGARLTDGLSGFSADAVPPLALRGSTTVEVLLLGLACLLGILCLRARRRLFVSLASVSLFAIAGAARVLPSPAPGELRVTFLAVGHGDAVVIRAPDGYTLLVDAGGDPMGRVDVGERVVVPALEALGVDRVDVLVLTHAHPDHYGGMPAVARGFPVGELWTSGRAADDPVFRELVQELASRGASRRVVGAGGGLRRGDLYVDVLHPPAAAGALTDNDASLVLRVRYGELVILLTGDIEAAAEEQLVSSGLDLRATVLKVPHHGSATSSTAAFLKAVAPRLAVAQSAGGSVFGFPRPEVEARYRELGIPLRVTGRHGALEVRSDGRTWELVTY